MEWVRLGDIAKIIMGQSPKSEHCNDTKEGLPFYQGVSDFGEIYPVPTKYCIEPKKIAEIDDILIGVRAPVGDLNISNSKCCIGRGVAAIRANEKFISKKYLYYFLKTKKQYFDNNSTGSTFKAINKSVLYETLVPIVDINKQKIIEDLLNRIENIIRKRKEQIQAYDDLIESLFQTLFVRNTSGIGIIKKTMGDVMTVNQGLQIPIAKRLKVEEENCYKYITIKYLNGNSNTEYIKDPKESVICRDDDILVTRTGNTGQVITGVTGVFHNNFFKLNYDRNVFNTIYLYSYLNTHYVQEKMKLLAGTSTIPDLNHGDFYKIDVLIPPIELQNKFADYVLKIEEEKKKLNSSLVELETLFDALMQDAFSGNLFKNWEGR